MFACVQYVCNTRVTRETQYVLIAVDRRNGMASARVEERNFKIAVHITKEEDSSPVFFKVDGERFKETRTLKLQIDTTYKVVLEIRPPMDLRYLCPSFLLQECFS